MFNKTDIDYKLYLVTDRNTLGNKDIYLSIEQAIQGGVGLIQLREKNTRTREFYDIALKVKAITDKHKVPLIINDRLDIALAINADGIHIGPDDIPISVARKLLGPRKLLGVSTSNLDEAFEAQEQGADYLGVGAMFPTKTKEDTENVSIADLKIIKSSVKIPVVAIGGINESNAEKVMSSGVDGIAVVSAILGKDDICIASKNLYSML